MNIMMLIISMIMEQVEQGKVLFCSMLKEIDKPVFLAEELIFKY